MAAYLDLNDDTKQAVNVCCEPHHYKQQQFIRNVLPPVVTKDCATQTINSKFLVKKYFKINFDH